MTDYKLRVFDTAGAMQFEVVDFRAFSYTRKVNAPGLLTLGMDGSHPLAAAIGDWWQVEVWRKPDGGAFARDFVGLARMNEYYDGEKGSSDVLTCPGLMALLKTRIVAWYANTANRSAFTGVAAETILKTLVSYNAGAQATTGNGRLRNGVITGLVVEADGAGGNALDWYCAFENLLETVQKMAPIAGGDFDLVKTSTTSWQFRWYAGQLGSDRSADVIFATWRGNMGNPQYKNLRIDERTVAIVGGKGEDSSRAVAVRTGANYSEANDVEMFIGATDVDTTDGLADRGDAALMEAQAVQEFSFDVLQTPQCRYGEHYFLGDLVQAVNPRTKEVLTLKVDEVTITMSENGDEKIQVRMA